MSSTDARSLVLDNLRVASPCPKEWGDMELTAAEAIRFCGDCKKNVYNVSQMSPVEVDLLLQKACAQKAATGQSSLCLQLYRRADGTVITDDCPVGLRRVRDMWRKVRHVAAGLLALLASQSASLAEDKTTASTAPAAPVAPRPDRMLRGDVMGGEPTLAPAVRWDQVAMQHSDIKALKARIDAIKATGKAGDTERLSMAKLYLEMGKLADSKKIPVFAQAQYLEAQNMAEGLPHQSALLRQILAERKRNDTALGGTKAAEIDAKIKSLAGEK